jgi:hypothetical protein
MTDHDFENRLGSNLYKCRLCGIEGTYQSVFRSARVGTCPGVELTFNGKPVRGVHCCISCGRELSATLDAYYGRDLEQARRCVKCRKP